MKSRHGFGEVFWASVGNTKTVLCIAMVICAAVVCLVVPCYEWLMDVLVYHAS